MTGNSRSRRARCAAVFALSLALVPTLSGCSSPANQRPDANTGTAPGAVGERLGEATPAVEATAPAEDAGTGADLRPEPLPGPGGVGATSHQGESFYVVICESSATKAEAQKRLRDLDSLLGDTGGGFFIDRSDHYDGMRAGWWVVFSAYEKEEDARDDATWFTRGNFEPYVKYVRKRCADPIEIVPEGRDL